MYDVFSFYHFNATSKKIRLLGKTKVEHGFVSKKYLRSLLFSFSEGYFKIATEEDSENKIYMLDECGYKPAGEFKKKYFSPEADEEPFDLDREKNVDFNGGMEWN